MDTSGPARSSRCSLPTLGWSMMATTLAAAVAPGPTEQEPRLSGSPRPTACGAIRQCGPRPVQGHRPVPDRQVQVFHPGRPARGPAFASGPVPMRRGEALARVANRRCLGRARALAGALRLAGAASQPIWRGRAGGLARWRRRRRHEAPLDAAGGSCLGATKSCGKVVGCLMIGSTGLVPWDLTCCSTARALAVLAARRGRLPWPVR